MLWVAGDAGPSGIAINAGYIFNGSPSSFMNKYEVQGTPQSVCYADCDGNGTLDIFDFLCFQNSFVLGEPYACDCDPDPACDIFDFLCFQNAFVAGCP